jgi:hypothetical protein
MRRLNRNKIFTLNDVRQWRELKKDELELEKLKLHAEKREFEKEIKGGIGKLLVYEGIFLILQKVITSIVKSIVEENSHKKAPERKN